MLLHLIVKYQWFTKIADGTKKIEYRQIKSYWISRLEKKEFSEIIFRNGYQSHSPFLRIQCKKIIKTQFFYKIYLGKILEIKNYPINR